MRGEKRKNDIFHSLPILLESDVCEPNLTRKPGKGNNPLHDPIF